MAAAKCIMSIRRWAFLTLGDEQAIQFVAMARAPPLAPRGQPLRRAARALLRCLAHAASARAAAESPGLCALLLRVLTRARARNAGDAG
jgi:hypothetical protein